MPEAETTLPIGQTGELALVGEPRACLVDGEWEVGEGDEELCLVDPSTETVLCETSSASIAQVERAVAAARRGFDSGPWPRTAPADRSARLHALADAMEARAEDLAGLLVAEIGCPLKLGRTLQVAGAVDCLRWFADAAERGPRTGYELSLPLNEVGPPSAGVLRREPAGVVAAITAYNYPILLLARKLGGALASGCTAVVMPSPRAPLSTIAVLRMARDVGIPDGAVNMVAGGPDVGAALTRSPEVDMVSFTGSLEVGSKVMAQAAEGVKKVVLELGGKSPNIFLPGADLEAAIAPSALRFSLNTGQACGATTRTLVPRGDYDEWVERTKSFFSGMKIGDPRDEETDVGPLIAADLRDRVVGYVDRAVEAGARVEASSASPATGGYFVDAMLIGGVDNSAEISRAELFGPVGVLIPYDDAEEAVRIANDSRFGLNANVWGPVPEALAVARRLRTGTVTINGGGSMRQDVPWGGLGASGVGREAGEEGFEEYFEVKHIQWPLAGVSKPFGVE